MPLAAFRLSAQRLVPIESESDSPDELTRQLPRGLYTTFSTNHNGRRVPGLTAHLDRLYVPTLDVSPSASRVDLRLVLSRLAASNAPGESRFRLLVSAADGTVYIIHQPFTPLSKAIYENGVKVITAELTRHDPRLKDSGFITESQSMRTKVGGDIFEVLLTKNGKIYEGMTSNFYAVSSLGRGLLRAGVSVQRKSAAYSTTSPRNDGATLVTARTGILLGVTRRAVLRLARREGMSIEYRPPRLEDDFAEAFLTSSSRGIVPIIQIDDSRVGEGGVGAWTKRLSLAYQAYVEERSERLVK